MPPKFAENQASTEEEEMKGEAIFPPWIELPDDVTADILHRLGAIEILESAQKVCTTWHRVCKDPAIWRVINMRNLGHLYRGGYDLDRMCRHAVYRSQGHLVDINLEYFAEDEWLEYIAARSRKLRRLRLACCDSLSDDGLIKAIKGFPLLEELHIFLTPFNEETIETVGRSCPLLTSFAFTELVSSFYDDCDNDYAYAIARSMPELRHLQLLGNGLTNEGLEAILNGCPHLESLDLRLCYHVKLIGDLGKRLSAQIKCLRYPNDSTSDYGFSIYDDDDYEFDDYYPFDDYDDYARPDHDYGFCHGDYIHDYEF